MKLLNRLGLYTKSDMKQAHIEGAASVEMVAFIIDEKQFSFTKPKKTKKSKIDISVKRQLSSPQESKSKTVKKQ